LTDAVTKNATNMSVGDVRELIMTRKLVKFDERKLIRRIPRGSNFILMYTCLAKQYLVSALRCVFGGAQNSPMNGYCVDRDAAVHVRRRVQEVEWLLSSFWVKRGRFLALSHALSNAPTSASLTIVGKEDCNNGAARRSHSDRSS
jgi:hypothetical protein